MDDLFTSLAKALAASRVGEFETEPFTVPPELAEYLSQQTITEDSPGTILRDFQTLLDFVGDGVEVSGVQHTLALKSLPDLNQRLSRSIDLDLKRPQQKSYPYINGLYLLLRASGLGQIRISGQKPALVLDAATLQSWRSLNPTERYFTLLETWLILGNGEIIGEHDPLGSLFRCSQTWQHLPEKGKRFAKFQDQTSLNYYPGLYNLALLDLFGFLSIQQGKPSPGKGWRIIKVQPLAFGNALMPILAAQAIANSWEWQEANQSTVVFGTWQPLFQPYFPEWQQNLVLPAIQFREGVHLFKVSLGKVWRRIAIPADFTFDHLSSSILQAFDFDSDHLYQFTYRSQSGRIQQIHHPYMEEAPSTDKVQIGELSLADGTSLEFLFDFGDSWKFQLVLESVDTARAALKRPKILEKHGKAPQQYPNWDEEEEE